RAMTLALQRVFFGLADKCRGTDYGQNGAKLDLGLGVAGRRDPDYKCSCLNGPRTGFHLVLPHWLTSIVYCKGMPTSASFTSASACGALSRITLRSSRTSSVKLPAGKPSFARASSMARRVARTRSAGL